jgi:hypothetical protein
MKNIYVLPTDKPSRLYLHSNNELQLRTNIIRTSEDYLGTNQNIFITSDEEIKEGVDQWYLDKFLNKPMNSGGAQYGEKQNVIILTTDLQLIADGVQSIDDEFLEWFVKNPSCESVEVKNYKSSEYPLNYKIIIPRETLSYTEVAKKDERIFNSTMMKQEMLEEVAKERYSLDKEINERIAFKRGYTECSEAMYSEEEVIELLQKYRYDLSSGKTANIGDTTKIWFEQFKKK